MHLTLTMEGIDPAVCVCACVSLCVCLHLCVCGRPQATIISTSLPASGQQAIQQASKPQGLSVLVPPSPPISERASERAGLPTGTRPQHREPTTHQIRITLPTTHNPLLLAN